MELEDLKKGWKEMEARMEQLEWQNKELMKRIAQDKVETAQMRLEKQYRALFIVCLCAPSWISAIYRMTGGMSTGIFGFTFFFLIMAWMKGRIWWKLRRIDYKRQTIKDILSVVYDLERNQRLSMQIGVLLAVPLLLWFMVELYQQQNLYALSGGACGLLVGGCVGFRVRKRLKRELRTMRDTLEDELN